MLHMTPQNMARSELNPVVRPRLGLGFQVGAIVTGRAVALRGDRRDGRIEQVVAAFRKHGDGMGDHAHGDKADHGPPG